MYPQVFKDYAWHRQTYGDVAVLPTPAYFYGVQSGDEVSVNIERGRQAIIRFLAVSDADVDGKRHVFFELNGQGRSVWIADNSVTSEVIINERADLNNENHIAAPMPGLVSSVEVSPGEAVKAGQTLVVLEAMKMQTAIPADKDGVIERIATYQGQVVEAKDLLCVIS